MTHFWLRAEDRLDEFRTPISPKGAKKILDKGHRLTVEDSVKRIFDTSEYKVVGCEITKKGSWVNEFKNITVIGLKEISGKSNLKQKHIMFAHAYKKQKGSDEILLNFKKNKGILYDLEYLKTSKGLRVAAFGYYAGFSGAFVGLDLWLNLKQNNLENSKKIPVSTSKKKLVEHAYNKLNHLKKANLKMPKIIVIGAAGRVGSGACDFLKLLGLNVTEWDLKDTLNKKDFPEILQHDIFINCVLASNSSVKFLKRSELFKERKLTLISDISCDPGSEFNTIPLYDTPSSFKKPFHFIIEGTKPLLLTAIDNLPAMLPKESSIDFENQILPFLLDFDEDKTGVWGRAENTFYKNINRI